MLEFEGMLDCFRLRASDTKPLSTESEVTGKVILPDHGKINIDIGIVESFKTFPNSDRGMIGRTVDK